MWKRPIVVLASCLMLVDCQRDAERSSSGAIAAASERRAGRVSATGRIEGWREADVASKLPGRVHAVEYEEGDAIEAGVPVVRLEDGDLQARVREAEARAREAALALARLRALRAQAIASVSELDRAESAYLTLAAALDEARVTHDYATIKAPFRGSLLRRFKEVGESVTTSGLPDPLFRIADLSRLKVTAEVPESDIAAVQAGQAAEVIADAYPNERFVARVSRIGLAVGRKHLRSDNPRERLNEKVVEVELELPGDARLKSGMTADVVFAESPQGQVDRHGYGTPPESASTCCRGTATFRSTQDRR